MLLFFSKINFVCDVLEVILVGSLGSQANYYSSSKNLELSLFTCFSLIPKNLIVSTRSCLKVNGNHYNLNGYAIYRK